MKKAEKKTIIGLLTIIFATICVSKTAEAATWMHNNVGWWWQEDNGSYPASEWKMINGKRYYFDERGYMQTGWFWDDQNWYYLGDVNDGSMKTGWCKVGNEWYYMYMSGKMASNTWIDSYWVNQDGAWIPNEVPNQWLQVGNRWWYRHTGGGYTTNGWELINGQWYHFDAEGWMQYGWLKDGANWYYLGNPDDGAMKTNQWVGDYYVGADGIMATNQWIGKYYVDETGKWDSSKTDYEDDSNHPIITQEQIEERRLRNQKYREQLTQTAEHNYISQSKTIYQFGIVDINDDGIEDLFVYTYDPTKELDNGPNYMLTMEEDYVCGGGIGFGVMENIEYCMETKHFIQTRHYEDGAYQFTLFGFMGAFFVQEEIDLSEDKTRYSFYFYVDAEGNYYYGDSAKEESKLSEEEKALVEQKMAEYLPTRTKLTAPYALTQENLDKYLPIDDAGIIAQLTE